MRGATDSQKGTICSLGAPASWVSMGVGTVDVAHQVSNDPVLVDGDLVGGQLRVPLVQELLLEGPYLGRDVPVVASTRAVGLGLDLGYERLKDQPGVADQGVVRLDVVVDVAGVVGGMDHDFARRYSLTIAGGREAAAYSEYQVRLLEEVPDGFSSVYRRRAQGQRVVFREAALSLHRSHHGCLQESGELLQLFPRLGVETPLSGVNHRGLGVE